jgi:hypothetical protein
MAFKSPTACVEVAAIISNEDELAVWTLASMGPAALRDSSLAVSIADAFGIRTTTFVG